MTAIGTTKAAPRLPRLGLRKWEAADTVIALAVALLFIVFSVFGFLVFSGYHETLKQAERRASTAADLIASNVHWAIGSGEAVLAVAATALEQANAPLDWQRLDAVDTAFANLPHSARLALYGPDGTLIGPADAPVASLQGTALMPAGGAVKTIAPVDGTGGRLIGTSRQIGPPGAPLGHVLLTVSESLVESLWAPQQLGTNSTTSIVRADGEVIARFPPLDKPLNLAALPVWTKLNAAESGSYMSDASPADGVARVVGFRHIKPLDLIVIASVSRDQMLEGLWYATRTVLLLMAPIALALLAGALITARLLRQTERNRQSLETALEHNEVLFREIHHRVKNNLQSVSSLLQLHPIPREIKHEMGQRIAAMSAVHEHIYRSNRFDTVSVRDYLHTLVGNIRQGQAGPVEVVEDMDDVRVDRDAATPLGLILNEVVSNAFKHAFPDGRAGTVTVSLKRGSDGGGHLAIVDDGIGFDPETPGSGIGRNLIKALTRQIGGEATTTSTAEGGTRFDLTFPIAAGSDPYRTMPKTT